MRGRSYYFRHLQVTDVPEDGDRHAWLEAFQRAFLLELARSAVYGKEPAARQADAVYFFNELEACESLLSLIAKGRSADAWFWPAVAGSEPSANAAVQVTRIIEKLRRSAAAWTSVAAAVLGGMDAADPVVLVRLLPADTARQWLARNGRQRNDSCCAREPPFDARNI